MTAPAGTRFRVNPALTAKRRTRTRRDVENTDYAGFASRVIKAHGRRVADGDIEALTELTQLSTDLDQAITTAISGLRGHGYTWSDIARGLGVSKQAAQQRWGATTSTTSRRDR